MSQPSATWACPQCTLHNDDDAMVCSVCGGNRPRVGTGKGKGRVLRPRACTGAASSNFVANSSTEESEEDFKSVTSRRSSRGGRGGRVDKDVRSGGDVGGECDGSGVVNGSSDSSPRRVVAVTGATRATSSADTNTPMNPEIEIAGAQQQPVELDGSDGTSDNNYTSHQTAEEEEEEEDSSGDNSYFGRGWGGSKRLRLCKTTKTRSRIGSTGGEKPSSARRGTKRPRPPPPSLSEADNIFKSGVHEAGGSGSDEEGKPLVPPPRRFAVATAADGRHWRWPPRVDWQAQASSKPPLTAHDGGVCVADKTDGGSTVPSSKTGSRGASSPSAENQGVGEGSGAATRGGNSGDVAKDCGDRPREGPNGVSPDSDNNKATPPEDRTQGAPPGQPLEEVLSATQQQQQPFGRKNHRKRSRLSLSKRAPEERPGKVALVSGTTASEPDGEPTKTVALGGGVETNVSIDSGDCTTDGKPEATGGAGSPDENSVAADEEGMCTDMDMDLESELEEGAEELLDGGKKDGIVDSRSRIDENEGLNGQNQVSAKQRLEEPVTPGGVTSDGNHQVGRREPDGVSQINGDPRGDVSDTTAPLGHEASKTSPSNAAAQADAGTAQADAGTAPAASIRLPQRKGWEMDIGADSDSDDSSDGSETQSAPLNAGVAHLGLVMDREGDCSSPTAMAAATEPPSSSRQLSPPPTIDSSNPNTECAASLSPTQTPPRKSRNSGVMGKESSPLPDASPDPSSMGLVDTPPPHTGKQRAAASATQAAKAGEAKTTRKSLTPKRASDIFASAPSAFSPPATQYVDAASGSSRGGGGGSSAMKRGGWVCGVCTLENRARTKVCAACVSPRPKTPPSATYETGDSSGDCGGDGGGGFPDTSPAVRSTREAGSDGPQQDPEGGENGVVDDEDGNVNGWRDCSSSSSRQKGKRASGDGIENGVDSSARTRSGKRGSGDVDRGQRMGVWSSNGSVVDDIRPSEFVGDAESILSASSESDGANERGGDTDNDAYGDNVYEDGDEDDEDWREEGDDQSDCAEADGDIIDPEIVGSQIEERCRRRQERCQAVEEACSLSGNKRPRQAPPPAGEILDLTDAHEEHEEKQNDLRSRDPARRGGAQKDGDDHVEAHFLVEDISDDDEDFSINVGGTRRASSGDGDLVKMGIGQESREHKKKTRKFRFFASVEEHRDRGSSCVDFGALAADPSGSKSHANSYEVRKKARDAKQNASKRGKKGARGKGKGAAASGRSRKTAGSVRGAGSGGGSVTGGGSTGGRAKVRSKVSGQGARFSNAVMGMSGGQGSSGGSGGLPSGSWIPAGIRAGSGSGGRSGRRSNRSLATGNGSLGGGGGTATRQPFNHYQRSDEMVEDSGGGAGGLHWEHAGRSTFGD